VRGVAEVRGLVPGLVTVLLLTLLAPARAQEPSAAGQAEQPVLTDLRIVGASVYTPEQLSGRQSLVVGQPLPMSPRDIAAAMQRRYVSDGYTFAQVGATIDANGRLTIEVDEGEIDAIEFRGVGARVDERLRETFAIQPGEIFNRDQANRALRNALESMQGAVERGHDRVFTMRRDEGRRVLEVNLRTRTDRSRPFFGTQEREDWYSPVDGFNPAFGFHTTVFNANTFNHAYASVYGSYKTAAERAGYAAGFERPFLADGVLQVGGSIQDLTASDDRWRLSAVEQSLIAFTFRNTFRDYYRRKGWQVHAAVRPFSQHEWLVAWRDESHTALSNETDYGLFRDDHPFRPNATAQDGDLRALVVGYTFDSRGLTGESPGERYRRHLVDDLFQSYSEREHGVRVEWRSELAPEALDHDFDFSRHVLNARTWLHTSPSRMLSGRAVVGFSDGVLPPQRVFGLGGIGTVHGYSFKEAQGERMLLLNGEFRQRFGRSGISGIAFVDSGRVYRPVAGTSDTWLNGVGLGLEFSGGPRIEFGWRLDDVPQSLQVLFKLNPSW
jgi:Omp85 superfamily domain